jgi:glycosyltransferase involved in cell wall biosynthesis
LLNIIRGLDNARFTAEVLTLSPEPHESLASEFLAANVKINTLGLGRVAGLVLARRRLESWIRKTAPHVIHTQGIRADTLVSQLGCLQVATLRNYPFADYVQTYGRTLGNLMARWHTKVLRRSSRVVAVSKSVSAAMRAHGLQLDVVYNGVDDLEYWPPSADEKWRLRDALGLPRDRLVLIATGHLSKRKNPGAMAKAVCGNQAWELVMLGDGPLADAMRQQWGGCGNIRFAGRQSNVLSWLQAADVFISTSRAEGLPNAVMEAMACGLPCVLSNIEPHRELLEPLQDAGVLVDGEDSQAVVAGIERIVARRELASRAARESVTTYFSASKMSAGYQRIYAEMVAN